MLSVHCQPVTTGRLLNKDIIQTNMDILQLTEKMDAFVRSKGWYEPDSQRPQTPRNLAVSLNLEASEVLEHFHRPGRNWRGGAGLGRSEQPLRKQP